MKVDFFFDTQYGRFCDALHLPDEHTLTEAELEGMKKQRLDNWIAVITAPQMEEIAPIADESMLRVEESTQQSE